MDLTVFATRRGVSRAESTLLRLAGQQQVYCRLSDGSPPPLVALMDEKETVQTLTLWVIQVSTHAGYKTRVRRLAHLDWTCRVISLPMLSRKCVKTRVAASRS